MTAEFFIGILWAGFFGFWILSATKAKKNRSSESRLSRLSYHLPTLLGFGLVLWHRRASEHEVTRNVGGLVTAIGIGFAVWARAYLGTNWSGKVTLKEGHELIQSGPYALARHPIYTGIVTAAFGTALVTGQLAAYSGAVLILVSYVRKMKIEEAVLSGQFGSQYEAYTKRVKRIVPWVY